MVVYNSQGIILCSISPDPVNLELFLTSFTEEVCVIKDEFVELGKYKVIEGKLIALSDIEIQELIQHNRFLCEDERLLESLKPSPEEVKKAEETLRLLDLLMEVL